VGGGPRRNSLRYNGLRQYFFVYFLVDNADL
jgi:hypothetical protein